MILLQVLGAHIVKGVDVSFADLTDGKTLKTINNFTLTVRKFNNGEKPSKCRKLLIFLISVHTLVLPWNFTFWSLYGFFHFYLKDRLSWFVTNSLFAPDIYIQNGNVLAKIEQADIGCTNGVIHIVSNVFRLDQFTVLDAIKGNNQLL